MMISNAIGRAVSGQHLIAVMILLSCSSGACGQSAEEKPVRILLAGGDNVEVVKCYNVEGSLAGKALAEKRITAAQEAGDECYAVDLMPGSLMQARLNLSGESEPKPFYYPYRGSETQPMVFDLDGFQGRLNGRLVYLDLQSPEAITWLKGQPDSTLKTIRSVRIGLRDPDGVLYALGRFRQSGMVVELDTAIDLEDRPRLMNAVAAIRPSALIIQELLDIPDGLSGLTHLVAAGISPDGLEKLKRLAFLEAHYVVVPGSSESSGSRRKKPASKAFVSQLAKMRNLRSLVLPECEAELDVARLPKLGRLRSLTVGQAGFLNFSSLAELSQLRYLTLAECEGVTGLDPIVRLGELRALVIFPMPDEIRDFTPLVRLEHLEVLMVDDESLKAREEDYDELREANPDLAIMPFCVGAAEILLLAPVALGLGLLIRRLRTGG